MNPPDLFKFNTIISTLIFFLIAIFVIKKTPNYSFTTSTISKTILHIENARYAFLFRFNFILKAILDLGFAWYVIQKLNLPIDTSAVRFLILQSIIFGSLFYFVEGKHALIHKTITYTMGVLWMISQTLLAQLTATPSFILYTDISTISVALIASYSLFSKRTNVFVQIICMSIFYLWMIVFVFKFL